MKRGLALAVAFGLFAGGPAPAHEGAESAGEGRVEPEVIPLHRIPALVDVSDRVLRQISALIRVDASIEVIEAALPDLQAIVAERSEGLAALLEGAPSRKRLSDSAADWAYRAGALDRWRRELSGRSEGLESSIQRLAVERASWELTLADARDAQAPETILHRLEALLARGHEIERLARERLTVVLTLQDQVAEQGLRVEEALDRIETAREEFRAELLVAEAEPLWRDLRRHDLGTHGGAVLESIQMDLRNLRGFVASNGPRLLLDLVIFILLLNAAFALRRRVAQWTEDDPQLGRAAVMLGRPVSLALLVSLLVFPSLHAFSPSVTHDIVSVLLLVPLLRVLPPLFERTFRPLLYVVGGLFLISRARDLIDAAPVGEQLLYAAQLVASIAIVAWLMRPARLRALPADVRLPAALRLAMRASLLLLVSALLANMLGYRSLSGVLGDGVLTSIYLALLAYGLVRATDVILRVAFHSRRARQLGVVRRRGQTLLRWTVRLTATGVGLAWVLTSLDAFAIREPVIAGISAMLTASLSVGELSVSLGDVLAFVLTIVAAFAVSNVIRFFLDEDVFPRMRLRRGVPNAISTLLHYLFLLLGFALALSAAGMDFSRVTLLAGAFGVGIGFGLQNVVNNFVSGLILLFERPIQLGDTVEVGGLLGEVRRIGARSSTVRTVDGAEVIVPNGKLISDQVINWTLSDRRRRIDVTVGVRYGTDPTRVQGILLQVAAANENVIRDPAPQALFVGFGDSSLDFLLRCWVPRFEEGYQLRSELSVAIYAALTEADIQIPFPQRDLHLKSVDGEAGRALSGGAVYDSDR